MYIYKVPVYMYIFIFSVSLPNTALPPPGYRPQLLYPPSLVPPPPGFSVPPVFIPPQINKPLSEHEFYRAKHRLLGKPK